LEQREVSSEAASTHHGFLHVCLVVGDEHDGRFEWDQTTSDISLV
jgi:hypothetical protein